MFPLSERKIVEVCYTPGQFKLYQENFEIVVVIDVLRATSAIASALHHGVDKIIPVSSVEEARAYQAQGYIAAAERDGQVVEGFPFGNSPYAFMNPDLKGKTVVLTTTNGTKAIQMASSKKIVAIGCLNNIDALCKWLIEQHKDTLILASGWKDKINLEDTICGGAIANVAESCRPIDSIKSLPVSDPKQYAMIRSGITLNGIANSNGVGILTPKDGISQ
jgi:2-phosphosulfolactate phosphatase